VAGLGPGRIHFTRGLRSNSASCQRSVAVDGENGSGGSLGSPGERLLRSRDVLFGIGEAEVVGDAASDVGE